MVEFNELIKEGVLNNLKITIFQEFPKLARGFDSIDISDDYIVTIRYKYKEYKYEGSLSFKDVVSDLIEDNIGILDIMYDEYLVYTYMKGKLKKFELIAITAYMKVIKKIIEKASEYIVSDLVYDEYGCIDKNLIAICLSKSLNFCKYSNIFLKNMSLTDFNNFEEFEENYLKTLEAYNPLISELLKSENLDGNSFKYLFKEVDKKTEKHGIKIDYSKSILPAIEYNAYTQNFEIYYNIYYIKNGLEIDYSDEIMEFELDSREYTYNKIVVAMKKIADKYYKDVLKSL